MPYHSRPISQDEIDSLPLRFVKLEPGEQATFTDVLLQVWCELVQSGSLAALPPVPDIVSFAEDCTFFYLIFQSHPTESPPPPPTSPSKRSSPNRRPHPYAHARPPARHRDECDDDEEPYPDQVIGCIYLSYSHRTPSTLDMGIALRPEARGKGFGRAAITKFLRFSFETLGVHRVVANVFGPSDTHQRQSARESGTVRWIFEKLGFIPEGVQRRAAFSPAEGVWRDVYPLAMLDVDWVRLCGRGVEGRMAISCPFEAMLERHTAEQEEMSEWMDDPGWGRLRRVSSTETIKGRDEPEPEPEPEPELEADEPPPPSSPIRSESSFSLPSEHDWRSNTPSTDGYSLVSHSPPPTDLLSNFDSSPRSTPFSVRSPESAPFSTIGSPDPTPFTFSTIGSPDLDPPLSPGFSSTDEDIIELAHLGPVATPYTVGPIPTSPQNQAQNRFVLQAGDEPLEYWPSDSDFDGSER